MRGVTRAITAAAALLCGAALLGGTFPAAGGAASTAACVIDPQLNHVTIGQGLPYTRLVRGKETLVRFYLSLPASIPRCGNSSRSIKINSATLAVNNGSTPLTTSPIAAQPEAINAEVTNTAPTSKNPSIPVNSPADPKFVVPGATLAPSGVGSFVASFVATIRYQSKGNDGVFTTERSRTFSSFTPPGGTATPASRTVEGPTKALRILVVPMGGAFDATASSAVGAGMTHLSRLFPVPDGTPSGARTGELTSTAGGLRYTVNSGVIDMTGLLDATGKFCGTSTNFARIQTQLQGFRNAWNGVVNGVDSPQDQDADKVVAVVPESRSYPSTSTAPSGCLEGFAMTNSNESWIRAVPSMAGPLFAMEICHTFGCVPDTGTFHSLYTQADNEDPDRAYNVLDRSYIGTDRTAMRLITPWGNDNTVMEKAHYGFLLCGFGGANTNGCPAAPATGTLTGVAASVGSAFAVYGTTDGVGTGVDETRSISSMKSIGAPLTVPDQTSPYRLVQKGAGGNVLRNEGVPVRGDISHHGHGHDHGPSSIGSFNVAYPAADGAVTIEFRFNDTVLYSRTETPAPTISDVSTGDGDVIPLGVWKSAPTSRATGTADEERADPVATSESGPARRLPRPQKVGSATHRPTKLLQRLTTGRLLYPMHQFGLFGSLGIGRVFSTFTVNSTEDPGVGTCDPEECTLREAINAANANAGADTIVFGITADGGVLRTIRPSSILPALTGPTVLDATTQSGYAQGAPVVEINGELLTTGTNQGLRVYGGDSIVRGLVINSFNNIGLDVQSSRNRIEANFVGTDPTGTLDRGNFLGVMVTGDDNVVGGSTSAERNVISGNTADGIRIFSGTGHQIRGNYVGTNAQGTAALGNCFGIDVGAGSNHAIVGNVASANTCAAAAAQIEVRDTASSITIQGNKLGTDATGASVLGGSYGVQIGRAYNNETRPGPTGVLVGGTAAGEANIIRGDSAGVLVMGSATSGNSIVGNLIGTNPAGQSLGGAIGVLIEGAQQTTVGGTAAGAGNTIAFRSSVGVFVTGNGVGNRILGNSIHSNGGIGIDLLPPAGTPTGVTPNDVGDADTGTNNLQNFPVVLTATSSDSGTVVTGALDGDVAEGSYRLEFFHSSACDPSGNGEGQSLLGAVDRTADGEGNIIIEESFVPEVPDGHFVTATATDPSGNTSEFSGCRQVTGAGGGGGGDPTTFTVNSADDADDGACTILHCSLREAINATNVAPAAQTISFAIGTGTQTISPTSALPTISDAVTIDGTTQPGYSGTPIIQVVGNLAPAGASGLTIATGSTTVRGLVVRRFGQHGILITGATSTGNVIVGNYIGTDVSGLEDSGNAREGIRVESPSATIGGTTSSDRNVVSGNNGHGILLYGSTNSTVEGNYVGTNSSGTAAIGNGIDGIAVDGGSENTIRGNVASGNSSQGIAIFGVDFESTSDNTVQGNTVGMDAAREEAVGNGGDGVRVHNGSNTTIGGPVTGANVIAYNGATGVSIFADEGGSAVNNSVRRNAIHSNAELGIDLSNNGVTANDFGSAGDPFVPPDTDTGPNNRQNFPVIRSASGSTINGDLRSTPSTEFTIDFYSNDECDPSESGEGERYIGSRTVTTNASGSATFTFTTEPALVPNEWVTATATDPNGNTSEFSTCRRVLQTGPAGTTPVNIEGTDENPENVRAFVFANCGGRQEPILVDAPPSDTSGNNYFINFNFDPKPACAGPDGQLTLTVVTTDGFATSPTATVTVTSPNEAPSPAIATDGPFVQWDGITLHGSAFDSDETIAGSALVWTAPSLFTGQRTGFKVNLTPNPSWTAGTHDVTLTATDSAGLTATVTKTITILRDADHDGCTQGKDLNDANKNDAYQDADNDGFYNCEDPAPHTPATSVTGTATFSPDPLVLPYSGVVTMTMRLLNKNVADVLPSSVELKSIDGQNVSGDPAFKATSVAVTNTGILRATFSGTNISNWLIARDVRDRRILVTMGGTSRTTPAWSFEGTGSTYVRRG